MSPKAAGGGGDYSHIKTNRGLNKINDANYYAISEI